MFHKLLQGAQRNILEYSMLIYNVLQHGRIWKVLECSIRSLIILGRSRNWRKKWKNEWYPDMWNVVVSGLLLSSVGGMLSSVEAVIVIRGWDVVICGGSLSSVGRVWSFVDRLSLSMGAGL